jgi:mono/diheme cytochrome c family protein
MNTRIPRILMSILALSASIALLAPAQAQDALPSGERPAEFTKENIEKGRAMYKQMCLRCHGPEMVGNNNAYDLRKFPLDDKARFFNSVLNGKRAMPALKGILSEEEVTILWSYVGTRGGTL